MSEIGSKQCTVCGREFKAITYNQINCPECKKAYNSFIKNCKTLEQQMTRIQFIADHRCGIPGKLKINCHNCGREMIVNLGVSMVTTLCTECKAEKRRSEHLSRCKRCRGVYDKEPGYAGRYCPKCREEIAANAAARRVKKFTNHEIAVRALQSRVMGKTYGYGAPLIDSGMVPAWTEAEYQEYVKQYRKEKKDGHS